MSESTIPRSPLKLVVLLALHAVFGVVVLWLLLKLVPQYEKIFKDFSMKLPGIALMVIDLSRFFGYYWFLLVPVFGGGDFAIMFLLDRTKQTRLLTAWGVLVLLAEIVLIGFTQLAVILPMNELIQNLSGGTK